MARIGSAAELAKVREAFVRETSKYKTTFTVCGGTGCHALGAEELSRTFRQALGKKNLNGTVCLVTSGCHGFCEQGPLVVVRPQGILYCRVKPEDVTAIVSETVLNGKVIESLLYEDPVTGGKITYEKDVPFYRGQERLVFGQNGLIEPTRIEDYIALGGYSALAKVMTGMTPGEVIEEVKKAGLRGRGGGGFPAARKWESCRNAPGDIHYVVCNADEGDPGAYMDRSLLEGNPHSVLEGMVIGAYAIGSSRGYVYVRNEYPMAVKHTAIAIKQAEQYGLLGKNILGTGFDFEVSISRGGGAFVCGESTALMASIEGFPGEPRAKHVHTVESGLWEKPTNLNNVETWANVPLIINRGAEWYSKIGTEGSKGTKIFSLVGKIKNTGLVEVPMGITLREIIYTIGGGIPGGKKFKAVQTGGPSGGCLPESKLDLPVDFDRLTEAGSMMGSGGMIVMDEETCMVDVAKYFMTFLEDESCGKCTTCREGIRIMHEILENITRGRGKEGDIELLEEVGKGVMETSLCALGGTAPKPALSTIRYFRNEYETHIKEKRCPAGACRALVTYDIYTDKCTGCEACSKVCPGEAISGEKKKPHRIDQSRCTKCGICFETCRFDAIRRA